MTTPQPPAATPELDAERAFLSCVLAAPRPDAAQLLAGMRADDFTTPIARLVAQLAIELTADNVPPTPSAILAHAATTGRVPALRDRSAEYFGGGSDQRYTRLAHWLLEAFALPTWPGLGYYLKTSVIEHAWRRAITEHATRLTQAATHSPIDVLAALLDDTDRITDLQRRHHAADEGAAARPGRTATPAVRAVGKEAA